MSNNNSMKQIPFTIDAFGPDGLLKEGYEWRRWDGVKAVFAGYFPERNHIAFVFEDGDNMTWAKVSEYKGNDKKPIAVLYRRTRTADDVVVELAGEYWDQLSHDEKIIRKIHVQAGMDEMS